MAITFEDTILTKEIVEKYTAEGHWTGETILDFFDRAVKNTPEKIAAVDKKHRITYKDLDDITTRIACGFLELGFKKGDVISIQMPNWIEFVYAHLAAEKIGAVTNTIIPYYRERELIYELGLTESVSLIIPDEYRGFDYTSMIPEVAAKVPSLKHIFVVGDRVPNGMKSFREFCETRWEDKYPRNHLRRFRPTGTDVSLLLFSSGTTAEPKGVMHINNSDIWCLRTLCRVLGLSSVDVVFIPSPISHGTGLQWGLRTAIYLGAKAVLLERWVPEEACQMIAQERCTYCMAATPFVVDLVNFERRSKYDLSSFRIFACAGAPIPSELARQAEAKLGCKLVPSYGETEHFVSTSCYPSDPPEKITGSDGCPIPGEEVSIFDENGNEVPIGVEGELAIRGPGVCAGYYKRPEQNKETFTEGGWQMSGDLGVKSKDGYIRIVGRKKDIIIRGGFNISPREIEDLLFTHPKIENVSVIGMPDERMGEKNCAYVIPRTGETISLEEIISFLKEKKLATQKLPERLEIVKEFPMTASGKVQKYLLRKDITQKLEREKKGK